VFSTTRNVRRLHLTAVLALAIPCATSIAAGSEASSSPARPTPRTWGQRLAETTIADHPVAWQMRKSDGDYRWSYTPALVSLGLLRLHAKHPEPRYLDYVKSYVDHYVGADGRIATFSAEEFNIDSLLSGRLLFPLLDATGDARYRKAIDELRGQVRWQPRTKGGVFWHKLKYPWQVWLDGLYMGEPFYAEATTRFGPAADFEDIALQFRESRARLADPQTGLLFHGWDESRLQRWSDPATGRSPGFWTRSLGWYAMALVESWEHFPAAHPRRAELAQSLNDLSAALLAVRDPRSKIWWQVPDAGGRAGNFLESSGSAMIVTAWARGARLGMLDARYRALARESFAGLVDELVSVDQTTGRVTLRNVCRSAGLGGEPYRDGSYQYYVTTDVVENDAHGVGAFLLASAEVE
jgi:unsaturated rhamnogalacturonyl hydrolase